MKREKALIIVLAVELNFLTPQLNMKADQAGLLFTNRCQMFLKKKLICTLVTQEQNIIVKNVEVTMDTCSMTGQNQQENAIATTACV